MPLGDSLFSMAATLVQRGLEAEAREDGWSFCLHTGTAVELLLKATLARTHPSLIIDATDRLSLVAAYRSQGLAAAQLRTMKTISLTEAVHRVEILVPGVARYKKEIQAFAKMRNGAAHLGIADAHRVVGDEDPLVPVLGAIDTLLDWMAESPAEFYGEFNQAVRTRVRASGEKSEQRYLALRAAARRTFRSRYPDEQPSPAMLIAMYDRYWADIEHRQSLCPACHLDAVLVGECVVDFEMEEDYADGETLRLAHPFGTFTPQAFFCRACGLELRSPGLLDAAGLSESLEMPPEDVDEFLYNEQAEDWANFEPPPDYEFEDG
jgi:hypothetical protein